MCFSLSSSEKAEVFLRVSRRFEPQPLFSLNNPRVLNTISHLLLIFSDERPSDNQLHCFFLAGEHWLANLPSKRAAEDTFEGSFSEGLSSSYCWTAWFMTIQLHLCTKQLGTKMLHQSEIKYVPYYIFTNFIERGSDTDNTFLVSSLMQNWSLKLSLLLQLMHSPPSVLSTSADSWAVFRNLSSYLSMAVLIWNFIAFHFIMSDRQK